MQLRSVCLCIGVFVTAFMLFNGCSSKPKSVKLGEKASKLVKEKKFVDGAQKYLEAAEMELADPKGSPQLGVSFFHRAAWAYQKAAQYDQAIPLYMRTLELQEQLQLYEDQATTLMGLARSHADLGQHVESLKRYYQAYSLQSQLSVFQGMPPQMKDYYLYISGNTLNNIAWYNLRPLGHYRHALLYYQAAISIAQNTNTGQNSLPVYQKNFQETQQQFLENGDSATAIVAGCSSMDAEGDQGGICTDYIGVGFLELIQTQGDEGLRAMEESCSNFGSFVSLCPEDHRIGSCMLNPFTENESLLRYYEKGGQYEWTNREAEKDCASRQGSWWIPER